MARKGARIVGDPCRMPCRVRKEVSRIRKKRKHHPLLFKETTKISGGGVFVLQVQNTGLSQFFKYDIQISRVYDKDSNTELVHL